MKERYPCMEADHYEDCPRFRKGCDAINCEAKYTWQEVEARRKGLIVVKIRPKGSKIRGSSR
jgi:hypothetical protein